ncbi:hypothetical protein ASG68_22550 [Rhizobium sp. Leaf453]|nr:hypothetical protein ASG68_22550 [Rhizobium sp. Leaf453]
MAYGLVSMHLVAMKIVGTVFRVDGTPWDYHNNLQPLALGIGGFATCEVVLPDPKDLITTMPQPAELHFFRVVQLEDGVEEIDLYDCPKLIMKFRPVTLAECRPLVPPSDCRGGLLWAQKRPHHPQIDRSRRVVFLAGLRHL